MFDADARIVTVASLLRHTSLATTPIQVVTTQYDLVQAVEMLEIYIRPSTGVSPQ